MTRSAFIAWFLAIMATAWPARVDAQAALGAPGAEAAGVPSAASEIALPFAIDGPAPPALPATVARDAEGRTTIRAIRLMSPLRVDGLLDEAIYSTVRPATDFVQAEPRPGLAASEKTEVWISFDTENVYLSVRAGETQPDRMVLNEMRRDSTITWQNENFGWGLDTFYDRRNGYMFQFTPIGGWADGQVTNEGQYNGDWNPIWSFQVRRLEDGSWTGEAMIPFKSLRYRPGRQQVWGIQLRRINRWKNENAYLTRLPDGVGANGGGNMRISQYATLVGIEAPPPSRAFDIKPYVTSNLTTDLTAASPVRNKVGKDFGFDAKYALTDNLLTDFTYNTDFAQVEADEQQVNLTRFSLFFPEKRDFFIENQGLFNFGGTAAGGAGDVPTLFYSRRIGLDRSTLVPIDAGGRLTGRIGRFSIGVINMQTDQVDRAGVSATNFGVVRLKRDILRRSAIGVLATNRSATLAGTGSSQTYGVDGTFAFYSNLTINTYWARTANPGISSDDTSYRAHFNYNGDRYGVEANHLLVGDNFLPEVGFVRRDNMRRSFGLLRFSPRPRNSRLVRKYSYTASMSYLENGDRILETREQSADFRIEFFNSDSFQVSYDDGFERLPAVFRIARGVNIPAGGYDQNTARVQYSLGNQHLASGTVFVEHGAFYEGDRTAFGYSGARVKLNPRFSMEPGLSINKVDLPYGAFTTKLVSTRATYTISPRAFTSGLVQYNSSNNSFSTNLRLRWEYQPGSELFVVYNESRDTLPPGDPDLQGRTFVVKVNRLLRF